MGEKSDRPSFFSNKDFLSPVEIRHASDFLYYKALKRETKQLAEWGEKIVDRTPYLNFKNDEHEKRWTNFSENNSAVNKAKIRLEDIIQKSVLGNTIIGSNLLFVLDAAQGFIFSRNLKKLKKIVEQDGLIDETQDFLDYADFNLAGETIIKIGGISIEDVMQDDENLSLSAFFRQYMESQAVKEDSTHEKVLQENKNISLVSRFPNISKVKIQETAGQVIGLWNSEKIGVFFDFVDRRIFKQPTSGEKELTSTARNMVKRFGRLRKNLHEAIFNPNSTGFEELKNTVFGYLTDPDPHIRLNAALAIFGKEHHLAKNSHTNGYRKAKELSQKQNENTNFYHLLEELFFELIQEVNAKQFLLTKDDMVMFLDEAKVLPENKPPTLEDLRQINHLIFQKSPDRKYAVDPKKIDWKNIVAPTSIEAIFSEGSSNKFDMDLHYENENGETADFFLQFDLRKNEFDWSFIESPNDQEMKLMKDAVMFAAKEILLEIRQQADFAYEEKQRARQPKVFPSPQPVTKKSQEPHVPRAKEEKQEMPKPLTPFQEAMQETPLQTQERVKIKNVITVPPKEIVLKLMKNLSAEDQAIIEEGISAFNNTGVGRFEMLKSLGRDGQRLYKLHLNSTGGKVRVLLHETKSKNGNGIRNFEIVAIGYRKDIYKKQKI